MYTKPGSTAIAEIRGKIGAWVYTRGRYGPIRTPYQRYKPMGSTAQNAWRAIYKVVGKRWWNNLTEAQRLAWRTFTEQFPRSDQLGQVYAPSGVARHSGCNAIAYNFAGTFLDDPPPDLHCHQPTQLEILTATAAPQALSIRMYGTLDANEYWTLDATPGKSPGRHNFATLYRPIANGTNALPYTDNAIAAYTAAIGALVAAKKFAVRFRIANVATGTISRPQTAQAIVT